ncbi:MAG TPA: protein kinase [Thermoanaerobaculia bacterium]
MTVHQRSGTASRPADSRSADSRPADSRSADSQSGPRRRRREPSRFAPGTVLADRYRIVRLLGRGGMGEVYRADDLKLGLRVALKFLSERLERDPLIRERFLDEVRLARQISHPNVCRVHDLGEVDGHPFLSMEHVDGEDLATRLRRGRPPAFDEALAIARQLCDALAAAHRQGILHRDLKPSNVMLGDDGRALLTDFGLGLRSGEVRHEEGSPAGWGTPSYMAPELHAGYDASVRSDLYALGLLLYELFTGRRAFPLEIPGATKPAVTESARPSPPRRPVPPSRWRSGLRPAVEEAILACLAADPCDRPVSVEEVAARLAANAREGPSPRTLMASELVSAARLAALPAADAAEVLRRHDRVARTLLRRHGGREVRARAALFAVFRDPAGAVDWALDYHRALAELSREAGVELAARVGIECGEAVLWEDLADGGVRWRAEGPARAAAARLCAEAEPGHTRLSRRALELARRRWPAQVAVDVEDAAGLRADDCTFRHSKAEPRRR